MNVESTRKRTELYYFRALETLDEAWQRSRDAFHSCKNPHVQVAKPDAVAVWAPLIATIHSDSFFLRIRRIWVVNDMIVRWETCESLDVKYGLVTFDVRAVIKDFSGTPIFDEHLSNLMELDVSEELDVDELDLDEMDTLTVYVCARFGEAVGPVVTVELNADVLITGHDLMASLFG